MTNRRAFLAQVAAVAAAGGSGLALLSAAGCSGDARLAPAPAANGPAWAALARSLAGRLLRPGDTGYLQLARPNNLRYAAVLPAGIALCANAQDVATSIAWARENGVALVARTGGHSYGGYSTTTGLMIDLTLMTSFAFDPATGIATLGGGSRNRNVYEQGRRLGVAITHGRCLNVGVAGLTLGGGVGFNMRAHGLTCDQLVATEIVTADGKRHALGSSEYDGLLWACRGAGGGNLGINTSLSFQTFPVNRLTAYDLRWDDDQEAIFERLTSTLENAPATLGCKVSANAVEAHGGPARIEVQLLGQFLGSPTELLEILQPVYALARPSRVAFLEELGYWDAQDKLSEIGVPEYFQERSRFFDDPIDAATVGTIFAWLRRWPATTAAASMKLFETGERVNAVAPSATAFVHRNSRWLGSIGLVWEATTSADVLQRNLAWQAQFYDAIVPIAKGGAYQNFIDPSLADWKTAYYGSNLARLETIKGRIDPANVFSFPEAIP